MTTRILIARHGNTFTKDQTPTRVGRHTDLPLVETELGRNLGQYLKAHNLLPQAIFAAPLKRTMQTAKLVTEAIQQNITIQLYPQFLEIDYGPDENKTELEVEARLGKQAIADWNSKALVPDGWLVDPAQCRQTWLDFATMVAADYYNKIVLVVASNGIIRFAPYITQDFDNFIATNNIKVVTGSLCVFEKTVQAEHWSCTGWNIKPTQEYL